MELKKFRISNYRSINDSGEILVKKNTALVGRNESGKTNLLLALYSLNPADKELFDLSDVKDFPRDRPLSEFSEDLNVVESFWELNDLEADELKEMLFLSKSIIEIKISRPYKAVYNIELIDLNRSNIKLPTSVDNDTEDVDSEKQIDELIEKAEDWILEQMPTFIFLDDYPTIKGHVNIDQFIQRKKQSSLTSDDLYFQKLTKVAGLDPEELQSLLAQSHEKRQQLVNRAGAVVTKKIHELWKDRTLKIRFNLDAGHFDTLISDPSNVYDVEVNLDERSRGFKWFFSFYITFAADTKGGIADNSILLLDEPGLFLHAVAQRDLLNHFKSDFKNQILYTTHSPFMVPTEDLSQVRTVNISQETGTNVTNDPKGDSKTLFPLQSALGYEISQTLFIGEYNLVVEGITDYWYISSISDYLKEQNKSHIQDDLVIMPCGGARKIPYMVALLTSQSLKVIVLLDSEQTAKLTGDEIVKNKIINDDSVIYITDAINTKQESDIEDLIDEKTFDSLVKEAYSKELNGVNLVINNKLPRLIQRYELAFKNAKIPFNKTRIARLFIDKMSNKPNQVISNSTSDNFESLFKLINKQYKRLK
jgi:predicted ATP-dependent endonuclease of OLD family